jgi:acetyl esterase/lipase
MFNVCFKRRLFMERKWLWIAVVVFVGCSSVFAQGQPQSSGDASSVAERPFHLTPLPKGTRVLNDIEYTRAGDLPVGLDMYLPAENQKPSPVVVWIHGGGWHKGSKKPVWAGAFIKRGYALVSIDYRLTGQAVFPAQIHDCKAAVRWLRAHAKEYNLDPERIGLFGTSAGGHLAALVGTSGGVTELEGDGGNREYSSRVQAVCDWYGPSDLTRYVNASKFSKDIVEKLVGGTAEAKKDVLKAASPVTYINKDVPPFFISHGDTDALVPLEESCQLAEALKAAGAEVTLDVIPGEKHGFRNPSPPLQRAMDFFDKHLKTAQ